MLKCKIGLHGWYSHEHREIIYRTCKHCGKIQKYSFDSQGGSWRTIVINNNKCINTHVEICLNCLYCIFPYEYPHNKTCSYICSEHLFEELIELEHCHLRKS